MSGDGCFILKASVGNEPPARLAPPICAPDNGVHGGNMAAVETSEAPKRHTNPGEDVETCGVKMQAVEPACGMNQKEHGNNNTQSSTREPRDCVGSDGGCVARHSGAGVESGAGPDKPTFNSPEEPGTAEKMAELTGTEQRASNGSCANEATSQQEENAKDVRNIKKNSKKVPQDTLEEDVPDMKEEEEEEEEAELYEDDNSSIITDKDHSDEHVAEAEEDDEGDADLMDEQKNCSFICQDCGKSFSRREMLDVHCHFHAQKDDLTPLTCEECGLTFQHRSGLVKHRNEHKQKQKQKEEELLVPKREMQTREESNFECAECGSLFPTVFKLREHNCTSAAEKPYHCPLCRQDFQFKVSVTKHMMAHSRDKTFTCQECNQIFPNLTSLRCHQRSHSALKPYECPECGMVFKHHSVMEDHRRRHTDSSRSFLCNICGKSFKYSSLLHQHQYLHTGQKPFQCPECGKKFAFAQNMKAHCRQHRRKQTDPPSEEQPLKPSSPPAQDTVKEVEKENSHQSEGQKHRFRCPFCSQSYSVPSDLKTHMLIHENEYETLDRLSKSQDEKNWTKGHTCSHCPSVFRDESSLRIHILSLHKSQAQCFEKVATSPKKQLNLISSDCAQGKGARDAFGVKSYRCSECGKTFRHRSVLDLHMRIHSKDKPYQCKVCGKSFRFNSYLQQHVIIHTGQKPYKCSDCGKEFAFLQNMRTHQRLHQEKPFRCTSCRKGYSDETQLQHHMLSHNGDKPHKCDLCDKSFGLAYLLRDHMNTHTGERPHRCDECNKTFSWFSSLLVHQKIHARKRQNFTHYNSFSTGSRFRGRGGSSVKKGDRSEHWDWSRPLESSGVDNSQSHPYLVSSLKDSEMPRNAVNQQSSTLSPHVDLQSKTQKDPGTSQPVQWKVDGGELRPVPTTKDQQHAQVDSITQGGLQQHRQRSPGWADGAESSHATESATSTVGSTKTPGLLAVNDPEQQKHLQPKLINWTNAPLPTMLSASGSLQHDFSVPSYTDGAALWSLRPSPVPNQQRSPNKLGQELQMARWTSAPASTLKEPTTPPKKEESRMWDISSVSQPEKLVLGLVGASTSAQIDQSSAIPSSAPLTLGVSSSAWDMKTPPGIPKNKISPENVVNHDLQLHQKQGSPGWVNLPSQTSAPKVSISAPYEPHHFAQGLGTSVWGFQSNPVGQTLLTGQLKAGNGAELQQQHLVTGTQLIINQPTPFLPPLAQIPPLALPGQHPLHSVTVGTLPRPPHTNIFFTPQAVMSERPHVPQSLLTPRTEPHKLGPRLPFAPERLLQCMICGCSFPRELDLQMHYLQHAQGEI